MYQELKNEKGEVSKAIKKVDGNNITYIPPAPANTDYQEYLNWLSEGNEPLPADGE